MFIISKVRTFYGFALSFQNSKEKEGKQREVNTSAEDNWCAITAQKMKENVSKLLGHSKSQHDSMFMLAFVCMLKKSF